MLSSKSPLRSPPSWASTSPSSTVHHPVYPASSSGQSSSTSKISTHNMTATSPPPPTPPSSSSSPSSSTSRQHCTPSLHHRSPSLIAIGIVIIHVLSFRQAFLHSLALACLQCSHIRLTAEGFQLAWPLQASGPYELWIMGSARARNAALRGEGCTCPTCNTALLNKNAYAGTPYTAVTVLAKLKPSSPSPPSMDTRCVRSISRSVITAASSHLESKSPMPLVTTSSIPKCDLHTRSCRETFTQEAPAVSHAWKPTRITKKPSSKSRRFRRLHVYCQQVAITKAHSTGCRDSHHSKGSRGSNPNHVARVEGATP